MKKVSKRRKRAPAVREPRADYDFSWGVRGKYAARFAQRTNVVLLEPDLAAEFRTAAAVNKALRQLLKTNSKHRTQRGGVP
jgi:hypothetical protein